MGLPQGGSLVPVPLPKGAFAASLYWHLLFTLLTLMSGPPSLCVRTSTSPKAHKPPSVPDLLAHVQWGKEPGEKESQSVEGAGSDPKPEVLPG